VWKCGAAAAAALDSERLAEESFELSEHCEGVDDDQFGLERGHDFQLM